MTRGHTAKRIVQNRVRHREVGRSGESRESGWTEVLGQFRRPQSSLLHHRPRLCRPGTAVWADEKSGLSWSTDTSSVTGKDSEVTDGGSPTLSLNFIMCLSFFLHKSVWRLGGVSRRVELRGHLGGRDQERFPNPSTSFRILEDQYLALDDSTLHGPSNSVFCGGNRKSLGREGCESGTSHSLRLGPGRRPLVIGHYRSGTGRHFPLSHRDSSAGVSLGHPTPASSTET